MDLNILAQAIHTNLHFSLRVQKMSRLEGITALWAHQTHFSPRSDTRLKPITCEPGRCGNHSSIPIHPTGQGKPSAKRPV